MSKLKIVFGLLAIVGVGGLVTIGVAPAEVAPIVTIGIGAGTAISAIIAFLKAK